MKQPLATLSFDALKRRWRTLKREDVEAVRDEEQLVALIAAQTAEDPKTILQHLAAARREGEVSLLAAPVTQRDAQAHLQPGG